MSRKLAVEADEKALDKNPYATRRMVAAVATVVSLIAYFLIPAVGYEAIRLAMLVVFFLLGFVFLRISDKQPLGK